QSRLLGHFEKMRREQLAASRMLPPDERFHSGQLFVRNVEQRLISNDELGALDGSMQLHLHSEAMDRTLVDAAVVEIPAISAKAFACARGSVGGSEKASDFAAVLGKNGDADAGGHKQLLS